MQLDQKALIEEAVQASIDAGLAVNGEHGVAAARHAARFMFNALQAVQPVPVVKIKPLEWRDHRGHTFPDTWTALTPCGVFEIEERSAGDSPAYFATGPMYAFIADKDSLEEAKAAAQADYERRISAALTAAVSAKPVAYTSQAQLDRLAEGKGGIIWSEPLPYHDDIALYAAAISGADNAE